MAYFEDNSISHDITTDAGFRAWAKMIHDGLAAVGLVNTSDTGQINLATVTTPGTNNTYAGYEIWRFDDALQATQPVFIKMEYGRGNAADRSSLRFSVGLGSNGSGTLTTASSTVVPGFGTASGKGLVYISFFKGALTVISCSDTATTNIGNTQVMFVERLRDPGGVDINSLIISGANAGSGPQASMQVMTAGAWAGTVKTSGTAGSPAGANSHVAPGRIWLVYPQPSAALIAFSGFRLGVVGNGDTGIIPVTGQNITYKQLSLSGQAAWPEWVGSQTTATHSVVVPHEA